MPTFELAVFYSGLSRNLGSGYNTRVDEAKSAAYNLKALEGIEYGLYKDSRLRDVPVSVYEKWKDRLPPVFAKRALHYYSEMDRVEKGVEAWKQGDIKAFGKLMFESGYSSINSWETGSPELIPQRSESSTSMLPLPSEWRESKVRYVSPLGRKRRQRLLFPGLALGY
ncbi:MAG: hypothetical protein JEY71_16830 [Sphaerochaeta sp.]|nr:hypothetical protein [Sphaerochaeta sp.]